MSERPNVRSQRHGHPTGKPPVVALLSENNLFREGTAELLRAQGFRHIREYRHAATLLHDVRDHHPDILMVDLDHENGDTLSLVHGLRRALPDTHVVVIGTALRQLVVRREVEPGLVTPSADSIALGLAADRRLEPALPRIRWNRFGQLTRRQRDVLRWLPVGADNLSIAHHLHIGERAVKAHISTLLGDLGLENRTQLAILADRAGLRPPVARAKAA